MTTPPRGPGRPGERGEPSRRDPRTTRLPRPRQPDPPTRAIRSQPSPYDVAPTERLQRPSDVAPTERLQRAPRRSDPPPIGNPPAQAPSEVVHQDDGDTEVKKVGKRKRDPLSLFLVAIIVVAVVVGGLAGAELYARHRAAGLLVDVTECVVRDGATVSFGVNPPFLWQYFTGDYTNISALTQGNQVQDAKGMTADVSISDVRLQDSGDSKGTIGSLNATLTWTAEGIKDTVAENLPGVGNLVTGVTTNAADGTMNVEAGAISITAKPVVTAGNLALQVVDVAGPLSKDTVQSALDGLTGKLNSQYPLGIHADSVQVTDTGVVGKFSTQNASIPRTDAGDCFARL